MMIKLRVFLCFLIFSSCAEEKKKEMEISKIDSLSVALEEQKEISDSLISVLQKEPIEKESEKIYFGREFDTIPNPEEFIKNSLLQNPEIIPLEPVLGGKMEFRRIEILDEKWVYALYDDGHIQGNALYEYLLNPEGKVEFRLLLSRSP